VVRLLRHLNDTQGPDYGLALGEQLVGGLEIADDLL